MVYIIFYEYYFAYKYWQKELEYEYTIICNLIKLSFENHKQLEINFFLKTFKTTVLTKQKPAFQVISKNLRFFRTLRHGLMCMQEKYPSILQQKSLFISL
jgi:hypothetical protein